MLETLRFLREEVPGCEKTKLLSMQPETAVRETYRVEGEYEITESDYTSGKLFDDAVCYSFYPIDVHDEHGVRPEHLSEGVFPTVPLRALVPKNSKNLLVAGRCVSSDRRANSALRVQASCMAMGQAAGAAAVLAVARNTTPLEVPLNGYSDVARGTQRDSARSKRIGRAADENLPVGRASSLPFSAESQAGSLRHGMNPTAQNKKRLRQRGDR